MLITVRRLPSIVVTLGMAFVWLGIAITILPNPGGTVPAPIVSFVDLSPPVIPGVVVGIVIVTIVTSWFLMRTRYGAVLRATGSNPEAVTRAGWSVLKAKIVLYGIAGIFGVLSGMVLSGQATSGDPNIAQSYILLSIAGVIVGGGSFAGGDVSPRRNGRRGTGHRPDGRTAAVPRTSPRTTRSAPRASRSLSSSSSGWDSPCSGGGGRAGSRRRGHERARHSAVTGR